MAVVTCHTKHCGNQDIPIQLDTYYPDDDSGEPRHVDAVICGVCSQPITDIDEDEAEG